MNENMVVIPEEYRPISMWGYFGYELLFSIPCIGFIALIVLCFNRNINVKNFARSYFCIFILMGIVVGAIAVLAASSGFFDQILEVMASV